MDEWVFARGLDTRGRPGVICEEEGVAYPFHLGTETMSAVKEASAVTLSETNGGKVLEVQLTGKLAKEDYAQFVPVVERLVKQHGRIRMLVEMHDFHGWTAGALWQDIKYDAKHFKDIERIAIVGETKWQHGMAAFCKPFTTAKVRYFERGAAGDARTWLESA
jgi:SpoIIAA-like